MTCGNIYGTISHRTTERDNERGKTMAMDTKVVTITPDMAREWLTRNMKNNRPVLKATVHSYARQMRNGSWHLTHQGIAFDENGELVDGQHRLHAIIEANVPVEMNVTYNVRHTPGELFTVDMGRKRTYQNAVVMGGIDDPIYKYMGMYVSAYIRYKLPGGRKAEPSEIVDYIDRHYDDIKKLFMYVGGSGHGHGVAGSNRIPAIVGAAMLAALYRGESGDGLYRFGQVYRTNEVSGCTGYNPKYVLNLRDYVKRYKSTSDIYDRCESTIWAFSHNLSNFRVRDNCYPLNAALDQ